MFIPFLMAPLESSELREALLAHLGDLFSLAQVVTLNADEAIRLVETTYQRAHDRLAEAPSGEALKPWLIGLMVEAHGARSGATPAESAETPADAPATEPLQDDFRRRLAEQFVHQALPAAFATLPAEQRLLLMLCHVQQLTCEEAGHIVGLQPDETCRRLEAARADLHAALYDNATEVERHLLATGLPEDWDRAALNHLAKTELIPLPPTLLSSVRQAPEVAVEPPRQPEQSRAEVGMALGRLLSRLTATVLLIMVAGLLGYAFSGLLRKQPETNLLTLSIEQAGHARIAYRTDDPARAEGYVREQMGWRLTTPAITDATLLGVDIREITEGIRVPVFLYLDTASEQIVTLVTVNYALLLDQARDRLRLERDVLRQIEDDGNFDRFDLGEQRVLIWRYRDEIFLAVAANNVADLRERIVFPS